MSADLDDLAARMILPAAQLVPAVQAEKHAETHTMLERLDVMELRALVVVLATWVPADDLRLFASWAGETP
jgi:hypothetical protein